ncbi:MAG TPA: hypothetical protein VFV02_10145, partial [Acidimicrobiales bacterium]|nr:hypothetical protein [Acidimicrobiales bacterium]
EPFGAVDPIARDRLQDEFLRLQQEVRKTVVFVTHDVDEAIRLGDRVTVLNVGGRLEQTAPPVDLLARPANDFVRAFLGRDRELKRLGLIPLAAVPFTSAPSGQAAPALEVPLTSDVRTALDAMLAAGVTEAAVTDDGRGVGVVRLTDLASLHSIDVADAPSDDKRAADDTRGSS